MRFVLLMFLSLLTLSANATGGIEKWVIDYSNKAKPNQFNPYQLIVFDNKYHPNLNAFKHTDKIILGYVSLGEVENIRKYFSKAKQSGFLLQENKNWPGSYFVDIRNPLWAEMMIDKIIPSILNQGFDGIFIDTLDNAEYLESMKPDQYKGMKKAAINMIRLIRMHFPHMKIMVNRGYDLLPKIANQVDYILAESLMTDIDFKDKTYHLRSKEVYQQTVKQLQTIQKNNPDVLLFSLDYWDPEDTKKIKEIYKTERKNGFIPYVSTLELNRIYPEPQ